MTFFEINGNPLRIIQDDKVSVDPQTNVKVTALHANPNEKSYNHIYNNGFSGKKVTLTVLVRDSDMVDGVQLSDYLESFVESIKPFTVVTEARDIPNGEYFMVSCKMTQEYHNQSEWSLTIMQNQTRTGKTASELGIASDKDTKKDTTNAGILSRCTPLAPGDDGDCVRALQQTLKNAGYYLFHEGKSLEVNGVYDENTVFAVSLLQRDNKIEWNLTVNGIFDKATKDCLLYLAG